jgi:hypothetical protein
MALPDSVSTERGMYLQAMLAEESAEMLINWPTPTTDDLALIGSVIVMYCNVDFNLRRFIEVLDQANALPAKRTRRTAKMPIGEIENTLENLPDMSPPNVIAIQRIRESRKMRNLMAHFAVRRFPKEDAFLFITKNAADFERVLGQKPNPGMIMTGVADIGQVRDIVKMLDGVITWLSQATREFEDHYFASLKSRS